MIVLLSAGQAKLGAAELSGVTLVVVEVVCEMVLERIVVEDALGVRVRPFDSPVGIKDGVAIPESALDRIGTTPGKDGNSEPVISPEGREDSSPEGTPGRTVGMLAV